MLHIELNSNQRFFPLDIIIRIAIVKWWSFLPKEAVTPGSVEAFKTCLDQATWCGLRGDSNLSVM